MSHPTYLLVHGAWSGSWCWEFVTHEFNARDVAYATIDLPSSTPNAHPETYLIDDARDVAEVANSCGPVMLVGHSYGGSVITEAAPLVDKLHGLIYVAALLPHVGQSSTEASRASNVRTALDDAIYLEGDALFLREELARGALYQDCDEEVANWALARLSSQTVASFRSPRASGDVDVPRRYVLCDQDRAIDPTTQAIMASRCGDVATLSSGHSPFLSRPASLVELLVAPLHD